MKYYFSIFPMVSIIYISPVQRVSFALLWFLFVLGIGQMFAQRSQEMPHTDISAFTNTHKVMRFSMPFPTLEGEFRVAPLLTLRVKGAMKVKEELVSFVTTTIPLPDGTVGVKYKKFYHIAPTLSIGFNQYINVKKRIKQGKRMDNFSANYLSFMLSSRFYETKFDGYVFSPGFSIGYGLNRNVGRLGLFGFSIGIDYFKDREQIKIWVPTRFRPYANLSIGILLPNKLNVR